MCVVFGVCTYVHIYLFIGFFSFLEFHLANGTFFTISDPVLDFGVLTGEKRSGIRRTSRPDLDPAPNRPTREHRWGETDPIHSPPDQIHSPQSITPTQDLHLSPSPKPKRPPWEHQWGEKDPCPDAEGTVPRTESSASAGTK
jgi:hypothetical protein